MWKAPLIFLATLLLGFTVARIRRVVPVEAGDTTLNQVRSSTRRAERWQPEDFAKWFRRPQGFQGEWQVNPLENDLKDWSNEEIRAALDQGLSDPECVLPLGASNELMGLLFGEWTTRDFDAALAWFESIPSESRKSGLSGFLGLHWPKDRAADGLEYVFKHRDLFKTRQMVCYGPLVASAISAAAVLGPGSVDEVLKQLRENQIDPRYSSGWQFPPGFDFKALAASPEASIMLEKGRSLFAAAWLEQDRNAAFDFLLADGKAYTGDVATSFYLYLAPVGANAEHEATAERTKWLAGKLIGLDADQRRQVALRGVNVLAMVPDALAGFTVALNDPEDRQAVATAALARLMKDSLESSLSYLEEAVKPEERLDLLETFEVDSYLQWFSAGQEALLRERLAAWNAPPERIEAIIRHRKEVRK